MKNSAIDIKMESIRNLLSGFVILVNKRVSDTKNASLEVKKIKSQYFKSN